MTKDPNKDANNMGGPSFHPELEKQKALNKGTLSKDSKTETSILKEDQVPPL